MINNDKNKLKGTLHQRNALFMKRSASSLQQQLYDRYKQQQT
jgi:hypothetical protein